METYVYYLHPLYKLVKNKFPKWAINDNSRQYISSNDIGPVHKGTNHFPKAVLDRDTLPDWVRDLNYMRSQALQTPSQSQTGSAHCEVIFCSYCAVRADWSMHGFSAHFQNAHARITFRKSFAFTCPQNQAFYVDHDPKRQIFGFKSLIWKSFAITKGKIRLSNQERVRIPFWNVFWNVGKKSEDADLTFLKAAMRHDTFRLSWLSMSAPAWTSSWTTSKWPPAATSTNTSKVLVTFFSPAEMTQVLSQISLTL